MFLEEFLSLLSEQKPQPLDRSFEAKQVIFNPPATIVYWKDGTKTIVRCSNDEFTEEFGFAMACVRKLYGGRSLFKAQYKTAQRPYLKVEKKSSDAPVLTSGYISTGDVSEIPSTTVCDYAGCGILS